MNSKLKRKNQILLSMVALLIIFMVGVSVTYSWIEGGTAYSIKTENTNDVTTKDIADELSYNGTIKLNPSKNTTITLNNYDQYTAKHQALYFSPVSSSNGAAFFLPIGNSDFTAYRQGTTNDKGTKYVDFSFDVNVVTDCYLAFDGVPSISITKSGAPVANADTSAFRFLVKSTVGTTSKPMIFSTEEKDDSGNPPLTQPIVDSKGSTGSQGYYAKVFSDYQKGRKDDGTKYSRLFSYTSGTTATIQISVWLESTALSDATLDDLKGCDISISNFKLIAAKEDVSINFDAVSYDNDGIKETNGFAYGSITTDGTKHTSKFNNSYNPNADFTAKAAVSDTKAYKFVGWYSDADCSQLVTESETLSKKATEDTTYYAKFEEKPQHTISINTVTQDVNGNVVTNITAGTATINGGSSATDYEGVQTELTAKITNDAYEFVGWHTKNSDGTYKLQTSEENYKVTFSEDITYYAIFKEIPTYKVTVKTDGHGTVDVSGLSSTGVAGEYIGKVGTTVTLTATGNDNYSFDKWTDSSGGTSTDNPLEFNLTKDVTYTASFSAGRTIYLKLQDDWDKDNAWSVAWVWGADNGKWYNVADDDNDGYHTMIIPKGSTGFKLLRMNPDTDTPVFEDKDTNDYNWNQSGDIAIDSTKNLFIAESSTWNFTSGTWHNYPVTVQVVEHSSTANKGEAKVNGATSVIKYSGALVTLSADNVESGYEVKWYSDSNYSTPLTSETQTVSSSAAAGSTVTFYAKYEEIPEEKTIVYLKPNSNWTNDNARFAVNLCNGTNSPVTWIDMTKVGTTGYYQAELPEGDWKTIIFCRMKPSSTNNWDNKWNQTGDLKYPITQNCCTINDGEWDCGNNVTWSTYTPTS